MLKRLAVLPLLARLVSLPICAWAASSTEARAPVERLELHSISNMRPSTTTVAITVAPVARLEGQAQTLDAGIGEGP